MTDLAMSNQAADLRRVFLALRRRSSPFPNLFVHWGDLDDGECGHYFGSIVLSPSEGEKEDSLVHETLHHLYTMAPEREIQRRTRNIMARISPRDLRRLTRYLGTVR